MNKKEAIESTRNIIDAHINNLGYLLDIIYNPPEKSYTLYKLVEEHNKNK
jgi:hypothetical protein